ncbi:MAG: Cell division protein FtsL [Deltaproteobacteria bacterium]|nr:Cell division protein FtsL [Deltaproteobacteria bacterium]
MTRITVGNGVYIISEIRRESPPIPAVPRRKGYVALLVVLLGFGLFNVWLSGQYIRTGYRVSATLEEKRTLQMEKDVLRTEMLALKSPSRIDAIARTELGMVDPRMDGVIR